MSLGRTTVVLISILLISKTISYSWSNKQQIQHFAKRDEPSMNEVLCLFTNRTSASNIYTLSPPLFFSVIMFIYTKINVPMFLNIVWMQHLD